MASTTSATAIPVIDMSLDDNDIIPLIADACSSFGFFQIVNVDAVFGNDGNGVGGGSGGISVDEFRSAMKDYFSKLPYDQKIRDKRHQQNARGYFDDELTKQKRDWKECLDFGVPGSRNWDLADDSPENECLDGFNVFPKNLPEFRRTVVQYFDECAALSNRLATLMAQGLGIEIENNKFLQELKDTHTSYLRLNYYPPCGGRDEEKKEDVLGISPHRDAGFLTILLQDEDCHSLQVWHNEQWMTIHPEPRSFTINTGDMCMLWSNGRYQAPLHRVLTNDSQERYSAPFFYNPGYHQWIESGIDSEERKYHACLYGYFRAVRFAGDLTDLGVEIQIQDYEIDEGRADSPHLKKQTAFAETVDFRKPFSVETYRPLLVSNAEDL
ncbi:iron ascorbate-dependent oxidoreductase [Fragilaria crotonensis]|nr:iron ascorbate-dependent oxidoreductase [Fragilaria crotonensis]